MKPVYEKDQDEAQIDPERKRRRSRGQVVKIKPGKAQPGWFTKVPPVKQYWAQTKNFLAEAVRS